MRRSTVRSSLALACVLLLGCEGRQDLTQHYGVTSPQGGASQGGNGAGAAGASAEAGSAGTIGVAGAAGVPSFGAAGKAGNGAGPSPAVPPSPVQVSGCAQGDVHPAGTLVACGLSPTADLVAVDETGFVIARRQAGGLQRIDRQTGAMQLIDDRPAGRGWRRERPSPLRGHELFVPDAVAGTLEVIDLRTGAHRLLTDELATTTSDKAGYSDSFQSIGSELAVRSMVHGCRFIGRKTDPAKYRWRSPTGQTRVGIAACPAN